MSELVIEGLRGGIAGREILKGVDLIIKSGQVRALMGPNGSGKSTLAHVLSGKPGYEATAGKVTLDGVDLLKLSAWERAHAGMFLIPQHPVEVPGVPLIGALTEALKAAGKSVDGLQESLLREAKQIGLATTLLERPMNVDLSGGEKKRNETLQLAILRPAIAILDEVDSGLDVDALRSVAKRVESARGEWGLGVLAITHFSRLLEALQPDFVHVFAGGKIVAEGGPELAKELERTGYAGYSEQEPHRYLF